MKISLFFLLILSQFSFGQSMLITPNEGITYVNPVQKYLKIQTPGMSSSFGFIHSNGSVSMGTYLTTNIASLLTITNHSLQVSANGKSSQLYLSTDGNVGIGTNSPGVKLDVNGKIYSSTLTNNTTNILRVDGNGTLFSSKQTYCLGIPASGLKILPGSTSAISALNGVYGTDALESAFTVALKLPDGAILDNWSAYFVDNSTKYLSMSLSKYNGSTFPLASISTSSFASSSSVAAKTNQSISPEVIDNDTYQYYIYIYPYLGGTTTWDGNLLTINHLKVCYKY